MTEIILGAGGTENNEAGIIYLGDDLYNTILKQKAKRGKYYLKCTYVFSREGKSIDDFRSLWESGRKDAGLEGRLFHDL